MTYTIKRDTAGTPVWYVCDRFGAVVSFHHSRATAAKVADRLNGR